MTGRGILVWVVGAAMVVLLSGCGDDSSSDGAGQMAAEPFDATSLEAVLRGYNPRIGAASHPAGDPFQELGIITGAAAATRGIIDELFSELPDGEQTTSMRETLESWSTDLALVADTPEEDLTRLQELATAWLEARDGPPPDDVVSLIDRVVFGFDPYLAACLDFARTFSVAPDCASVEFGPGNPLDEQVDAAESGPASDETTTLGDIEISVDRGLGVGSEVMPDLVIFDLADEAVLFIMPPPAVTEPGDAAPEEIPSPIPWPTDPSAWAAELPVTIDKSEVVDAGTNTFATTRILGDETLAVIAAPQDGLGWEDFLVEPGVPLQWWDGVIGGQRIVAVMRTFPDTTPDLDGLEALVEEILASVAVVG